MSDLNGSQKISELLPYVTDIAGEARAYNIDIWQLEPKSGTDDGNFLKKSQNLSGAFRFYLVINSHE